jgi:hypothetical protein
MCGKHTLVAESGIHARGCRARAAKAGANAILVGESLMRSGDIAGKVERTARQMNTKIKICGTTNLNDALLAVELGADALGFIFYPKSPRYITVRRSSQYLQCLAAVRDQGGCVRG